MTSENETEKKKKKTLEIKFKTAIVFTPILVIVIAFLGFFIISNLLEKNYKVSLSFPDGLLDKPKVEIEPRDYSLQEFFDMDIFSNEITKDYAINTIKTKFNLYELDNSIILAIEKLFQEEGYDQTDIRSQETKITSIENLLPLVKTLRFRAKEDILPFVKPGISMNCSVPNLDVHPPAGEINVRMSNIDLNNNLFGKRVLLVSPTNLKRSLIVDASRSFSTGERTQIQLNRKQSVYLFGNELQTGINEVYVSVLNNSLDISDPSTNLKLSSEIIALDIIKYDSNIISEPDIFNEPAILTEQVHDSEQSQETTPE